MIWVIGDKGMLGSEVAALLNEKGFLWVGSSSEVDITNPKELEKFITTTENQNYFSSHKQSKNPTDRKITWIINCAAYSKVDDAEDEDECKKAEAVNKTGALNIARIARNHGSKLIHISTDYVFDGTKNTPYKENDQKNPLCVYAKTKSDGEDEISFNMTQYYILRTAWLFGFKGKNFVRTMIQLFNENDEVKVVNDQLGSPTSCADLAKVIVLLIERNTSATSIFGKNSAPSYGIYHFTNEGSTSWFEFAKKIYIFARKSGALKKECKILPCKTSEFPAKAKRPQYSVLSKEKITKELRIKIPEWEYALKQFMFDKRFKI